MKQKLLFLSLVLLLGVEAKATEYTTMKPHRSSASHSELIRNIHRVTGTSISPMRLMMTLWRSRLQMDTPFHSSFPDTNKWRHVLRKILKTLVDAAIIVIVFTVLGTIFRNCGCEMIPRREKRDTLQVPRCLQQNSDRIRPLFLIKKTDPCYLNKDQCKYEM